MRKPNWRIILLGILFLAFGSGVLRLFDLRFETGDVYPAYSSLRTDPLGVGVFYRSLDALAGITVSRNLEPPERFKPSSDMTVLICAATLGDLSRTASAAPAMADAVLRMGGRAVILFAPQCAEALRPEPSAGDKASPEKKDQDVISMPWEVAIGQADPVDGPEPGNRLPKGRTALRTRSAAQALPGQVIWHSNLFFTAENALWKPIYTVDGRAVFMTRNFGRGSLILATDCFFISNEALQQERYPALLAWLVGAGHHVVFDEFHLGLRSHPGVAALGRKYGLHGFLAGLLVVAALFIWKNAVSFIPARDSVPLSSGPGFKSRRDATEGLIGLLRRNIPATELLAVCLAQWAKTVKPDFKHTALWHRLQAAAQDKNPVRGYQGLCRLVAERRRGQEKGSAS